MKRYINNSGSASISVSAMFGTAKYVQFGILVFLEAEEVISRGNLQASKSDGYFIFL